ncbi:MAG: deoxyribodipyrimidine photo-lyase, partial [Myxococcota bacterium]
MKTIVWFRGKDLRVADHAPLRQAMKAGEVIPLFVVDPYFFAPERARQLPHRMQFLLDSLVALSQSIAERGSRLVVVEGRSVDVVPELARRWAVDRVVAHRWVEPFGRRRDTEIASALGPAFELHEGELLNPPGVLRSGSGRPYAVFTPFARAFARDVAVGRPLPAPRRLPPLPKIAAEEIDIPSLRALGLERNPRVLEGGETAGRRRLDRFVRRAAVDYHRERDRMDHAGTSRLSADLKFGTVSPRQAWAAVTKAHGDAPGAAAFRNELVWREFSYGSLWDRPEAPVVVVLEFGVSGQICEHSIARRLERWMGSQAC